MGARRSGARTFFRWRAIESPGTGRRQEWTHATHHDNDVQPRNGEVDRAVAELYAARARAEATEANRDGRYDHARQVLEATARRIREYAGDDPKLRHLAEKQVAEEYVFGMPMALMARKASYSAAETALKGRDPSGRARR